MDTDLLLAAADMLHVHWPLQLLRHRRHKEACNVFRTLMLLRLVEVTLEPEFLRQPVSRHFSLITVKTLQMNE